MTHDSSIGGNAVEELFVVQLHKLIWPNWASLVQCSMGLCVELTNWLHANSYVLDRSILHHRVNDIGVT